MPVQNYSINIAGAQEGTLIGLTYTNSKRESFRAKVALTAGKVVKHSADREVDLGSAGAGQQFGVVIRQLVNESDFRPNTGAAPYPIGSIVPVLLEGSINVVTVAACTYDGAVYVNSTTGQFTSAVTAGYVKASNMKFKASAGAGDVVGVDITVAMINGTAV
ncbi:structural cement protein Gp24 [Pseudomonas laurylsulfatiphila]|uniref:structural cement protein Gp24 n=1 Tax=Pseudomonas laurylsulfatiphila TaxID=2011015 RepID=UPI003D25463F